MEELNVFVFKKRGYLVFLVGFLQLVLIILLFFLNVLLSISLAYFTIWMVIISYVLVILISKFRFINNGKIQVSHLGVFTKNSSFEINSKWENITEAKIYYVRNQKEMFASLFFSGFFRYHNLMMNWKESETHFEKLVIGGREIYLKTRNEAEYEVFLRIVEIFKSNVKDLKVYSKDTTETEEFALEYPEGTS